MASLTVCAESLSNDQGRQVSWQLHSMLAFASPLLLHHQAKITQQLQISSLPRPSVRVWLAKGWGPEKSLHMFSLAYQCESSKTDAGGRRDGKGSAARCPSTRFKQLGLRDPIHGFTGLRAGKRSSSSGTESEWEVSYSYHALIVSQFLVRRILWCRLLDLISVSSHCRRTVDVAGVCSSPLQARQCLPSCLQMLQSRTKLAG